MEPCASARRFPHSPESRLRQRAQEPHLPCKPGFAHRLPLRSAGSLCYTSRVIACMETGSGPRIFGLFRVPRLPFIQRCGRFRSIDRGLDFEEEKSSDMRLLSLGWQPSCWQVAAALTTLTAACYRPASWSTAS